MEVEGGNLLVATVASKAVVDILPHGIKITVEEGRSIQASAYVAAESFSSYSYNPPFPSLSTPGDSNQDLPPRSVFGISLHTLLECLNIFGNAGAATGFGGGGGGESGWKKKGAETEAREVVNDGKMTSLRMSYAGEGEPLVLLLEEGGIVTRCEITTYEPDDLMELPFDDDTKVQKLIMKSEWLRDAFAEIDPSSEKLTIIFSPADHAPTPYNRWTGNRNDSDDEDGQAKGTPTFRLESHGGLGSTEMDYPNDRDVLETFECGQLVRNSYKFSHIQLTSRALLASSKTSIRTGEDGLLNFQFMIPLGRKGLGESKEGFVEFVCVPLDEEN